MEKFTSEQWQKIEEEVGKAEKTERKRRAAEVEIYQTTGRTQSERGALGKENIESLEDEDAVEIARELEREKQSLALEAETLLGPEDSPQRALIALQKDNLWNALRENRKIELEKDHLFLKESRLLKDINEARKRGALSRGKSAIVNKTRQHLEQLEGDRQKLLLSSPEAFYGLHLKGLKEYKKDLETGRIAETPYVKKQADDVVVHLRAGDPVMIYGHLGAGKTELAMHVAKNYILKDRPDIDEKIEIEFQKWLSKNPDKNKKEQDEQRKKIDDDFRSALVISGSKYMSMAELYGHQVLSIDKIDKAELDNFVKEVEQKFDGWATEHKDASEEDLNRAHDRLLQTYLTQFKSGTISSFFLGPIYEAMEGGRPVIIDEVNAIPHEVLISLNHILTRQVGDKINVQQNSGKTIEIKDGFGVIMTGNLNQGQEKYIGRQDMDPAFLSRLSKLEYDYLPQKTEGSLEDEAGEGNELFHLLLSRVMDKNGNLEAPQDAVKKLWNLAKATRITQDVFAGREIASAYYLQEAGGRRIKYLLKESVLSFRDLNKIIKQWQNNEYKYDLDYYIWNEFISQSTSASDRAYLYQLFKDRFNFFQGDGWEQNPNYGAGGLIASFDIKSPQNPSADKQFLGPREVVEFAFGKAPERARWPEIQKEKAAKGELNLEEIYSLENFKNSLSQNIANLEQEVNDVCEVKKSKF